MRKRTCRFWKSRRMRLSYDSIFDDDNRVNIFHDNAARIHRL